MPNKFFMSMVAAASVLSLLMTVQAEDIKLPVTTRFADAGVEEVPSFQKHVMPLFGRLGCNGRACHGSFQGRGGFRLSLFGYDFKFDHDALLDEESPRVDIESPLESLIIVKPTDADNHEGGQRYKKDSWEYHLIRRWLEGGAKFDESKIQKLAGLDIQPSELQFTDADQTVQLCVVAVWEDGQREDVTPLCRFSTNDETLATIDNNGLVTSGKTGDTHIVISYDKAVVPVPVIRPVSDLVADKYPQVETPTKVDELVVNKLRKLGIVPSEICTDAEFLRRIHLDLTGTLPTTAEVEAFLSSDDPGKRAKKVDELLDTPAYAAWWTTKLCDYTGNNDQNLNNISPVRNRPAQDWYDWIYKRVDENLPYDQLAAGIITAKSMQPGQTYTEYCKEMSDLYRGNSDKTYADLPGMAHYWSRRDFQQSMEARAIGFAYSFMGLRIQCAQCHKHPFDQWSKDDFHQFKNFFARIIPARRNAPREYRDEYNAMIKDLGLKGKPNNELRKMIPELLKEGKTIPFGALEISNQLQKTRQPDAEYPVYKFAKLLGGDRVDVLQVDDPRTVLMDWLRSPDNPFFAKAFVNRVWASYFNVGIVNPPDDMNLANPPSNKPLLDYLSKGFIEHKFDMKWVHRTIANSATYQRSWKPNETNKLDERNFSRAVPRRLPAEVAYDAIQQATASDEVAAQFCSNVSDRAISIAAASSRPRGNDNRSFALSVFGRSTRETNCDCDRSSEASLLQTVFLQNDRSILESIGSRRGWLDQVSAKLSPPANPKDAQAKRKLASLRKQVASYDSRLRKLRKSGNTKAIEQNEKRLVQLRKQVSALTQSIKADEPKKVDDAKVGKYVIDAYLRTLSRYPSEQELDRSVAYVQDGSDPVEGVRDVLWALLNTKEFIVNH